MKYAQVLLTFLLWVGCDSQPRILDIDYPQIHNIDSLASPVGETDNILHVTTLADNGDGSLRHALETARGHRKIVFDIAGTIELDDDIAVRNPYVTVDGLSAPSPGITLRHFGLKIRTHDVKISHIRIHVGDENKDGHPEYGNHDAIDIAGNNEDTPVNNIIIDHCSMYWAIDEAASTWSADYINKVTDVTFSNCIFGESLSNSIHPEGPHSCGPLIGYNSKRIFLIRNLIAHCADRNPNINGGTETVIVNNVIYDPWTMFIHVNNYHGASQPKATIIGNICIKGPSARDKLSHSVRLSNLDNGAEIFVDDNPCDAYIQGDPWSCVAHNLQANANARVMNPPVWSDSIGVFPSDVVEDMVLRNVGARPNARDRTDKRLIAQVMRRTGRIIDSQSEVLQPNNRREGPDVKNP